MAMKFKTKLFVILWIAGIVGVLSFTLVDILALLASFPATAGKPIPFSPMTLKLLTTIQTSVLLSIAVWLGVVLAPKVNLSSPMAEAAANNTDMLTAFRPQFFPGLISGALGGTALVLNWVAWKPYLSLEFVTHANDLPRVIPLTTRLLYGGITEELLLRWGVMTFLLWIMLWIRSRWLQKGQGTPRSSYYVTAIVVSALLFGVGHLPLASALVTHITAAEAIYVILANSLFGVVAGYLYWKKGLESAIIAHMSAHVVIFIAQSISN